MGWMGRFIMYLPLNPLREISGLNFRLDSYRDSREILSQKKLVYRGYKAFDTQLREVEKTVCDGEWISGFGRETLEGVCKYNIISKQTPQQRKGLETILFQDDKKIALRPVDEVAITATGQVAVITNGTPINHFSKLKADSSFVAGQCLEVYPSITCLYPANKDTKPLLKLKFITEPKNLDQIDGNGTSFSSLSAGDAHFSFIVNHHNWSNNTSMDDIVEPYYNKVWSIRTDKRSLHDEAWIPLEEELDTLGDEEFITIEGEDVLYTTLGPRGSHTLSSDPSETTSHAKVMDSTNDLDVTSPRKVEIKMKTLGLFVVDCTSWDVEFQKCHSNGWITIALSVTEQPFPENPQIALAQNSLFTSTTSDIREGYLFPFGKAVSMIPGLEIGAMTFEGVVDISCGSEHVVVLLENGQVWSFGNNGYGQRGIEFLKEEEAEGWREVEGVKGVKKILCGKWNTFFVVERGDDDVY
jgi:hypothetical protein